METVVFDKDTIKKMLHESVCEVTFTKVNGDVRVMPCTLKADILPPMPVHVTNTDNPVDFPKVKKENPDVMSVFCMDKKEWRSFRVANVLNVKALND